MTIHGNNDAVVPLDLFTPAESHRLIMNLAHTCHERGFTEEQFVKLYEWAHRQRIGAVMLKGALCGQLSINVRDGEVVVGAPEREDLPEILDAAAAAMQP